MYLDSNVSTVKKPEPADEDEGVSTSINHDAVPKDSPSTTPQVWLATYRHLNKEASLDCFFFFFDNFNININMKPLYEVLTICGG